MPARLATPTSGTSGSRLLHSVRIRDRGQVEITVRHRDHLIRCIVVGTVLVQRLRVLRRAAAARRRPAVVQRLTTTTQHPKYRFTCTVCKNVCGRKQKHVSGCPSCVDHDIRPEEGQVKSTGVCLDCAEKWKRANRGKEICVTCNREIVSGA